MLFTVIIHTERYIFDYILSFRQEFGDISEQNENHFETIEEIMTAIINGMDKLSKKLNCVEFRDEYIQFQKVQIEIDKLMEQLGLVCEEM